MFHHVLVYMGHLYSKLQKSLKPTPKKLQKHQKIFDVDIDNNVYLELVLLPHVLPLTVHLEILNAGWVEGTISRLFYYLFFKPPFSVKVRGVGGLGGQQDFSFSPGPLGTN